MCVFVCVYVCVCVPVSVCVSTGRKGGINNLTEVPKIGQELGSAEHPHRSERVECRRLEFRGYG